MMAAHQSMAYTGECQTTSGCLSNLDCTSGAFCAMPEGDCDGPGACAPKPQVCPMIFDPVCGCDGQEYSNSCLAASEGVSVDYPGACL
ncbi:MAG: hypothetical protein FJ098_10130 [Deltaproteobacteria bacterium]|nr:hypothetical protein [Deltaproteobacteria bacterium]